MSGGGKRLLAVPLPRIVTGTMPRCRSPERVVVVDEVPMLVTDLPDGEAPLAMIVPVTPGGSETAHGCGAFRLHGADWYRPVEYGPSVGGCTPEEFGAALLGRVARATGLGECADLHPRQELADWSSLLDGASRRRGLLPAADARFVSVDDDGRAAQAGLAEHVRATLAVIGGRVHHRVPAPAYRVAADINGYARVERVLAPMVPHGTHGPREEWASSFPLTRRDDAKALADAIAREIPSFRRAGDEPAFVLLAPREVAAAEAAAARPSPAEAVARAGRDHALATQDCAGYLDDAGLATYAALRSGTAGESPDEVLAAMASLAKAVRRAQVRHDSQPPRYGSTPPEAFMASFMAHERIRIRVEAVEGPEWALSGPDADAMAGLGTAP